MKQPALSPMIRLMVTAAPAETPVLLSVRVQARARVESEEMMAVLIRGVTHGRGRRWKNPAAQKMAAEAAQIMEETKTTAPDYQKKRLRATRLQTAAVVMEMEAGPDPV